MNTLTNKHTATRFYDAFNARDWDAMLAELTPGFIDRRPQPGQGAGPRGLVAMFQGFCAAFPDAEFAVVEMAGEDERLAVRFVCRATHQGRFGSVPPSGRAVEVQMVDVLEFAGGKIAAGDHYHDTVSFLVQIGALEMPQ